MTYISRGAIPRDPHLSPPPGVPPDRQSRHENPPAEPPPLPPRQDAMPRTRNSAYPTCNRAAFPIPSSHLPHHPGPLAILHAPPTAQNRGRTFPTVPRTASCAHDGPSRRTASPLRRASSFLLHRPDCPRARARNEDGQQDALARLRRRERGVCRLQRRLCETVRSALCLTGGCNGLVGLLTR